MKKMICILLAAVLLAGCAAAPAGTTLPPETTMPTEATPPPETTVVPQETAAPPEQTEPESPENPRLAEEPVSEPDWNDPQQAEQWFGTVAMNYVIKYINTAWLLHGNDFETGTLLSLTPTQELDSREYRFGEERQTLERLRKELEHTVGMAEYYWITRYLNSNVGVHGVKLFTSDIQITVEEETATVTMGAGIEFVYNDSTDPSGVGDEYRVHFAKIDGTWLIVDMDVSEFEYLGYTVDQFDPEEALKESLLIWARNYVREQTDPAE